MMPSLDSFKAVTTALLLITLTTLRTSIAIPLELGEGASSRQRHASQFQSGQFPTGSHLNEGNSLNVNDRPQLSNDYSEEGLLKMIDNISNISDDVPRNVPQKNIYEDRMMSPVVSTPSFNLLNNPSRGVIQIVNPKYVASVKISPPWDNQNNPNFDTNERGSNEVILSSDDEETDQNISLNIPEPMRDEADSNDFNEVVHLSQSQGKNVFLPWQNGFFGGLDIHAMQVDEAETGEIPEQDVGEQESENERNMEEINAMSKNEDETSNSDEIMQPANSNHIAYSYNNFIPNSQQAQFSNYNDPRQFGNPQAAPINFESVVRGSPQDFILRELKSLAWQIGQSPIMNALFTTETVPFSSGSPAWPSRFEAQTYLPPNNPSGKIYLSPNVAAAQDRNKVYVAPSVAALHGGSQPYTPSNVVSLLNEAQNYEPYRERNGPYQNDYKVYISPNLVGSKNNQQAYTTPNRPQVYVAPNLSSQHKSYVAPNIVALQNAPKPYVPQSPAAFNNGQQPYVSPNIAALQKSPETFVSQNLAAFQNGRQPYVSPNIVAQQNQHHGYVSPNIAALQQRPKAFVTSSLPNGAQVYVQSDENNSQNDDDTRQRIQNQNTRRAMVQIATNDLSPEILEQLQKHLSPAPTQYIANVMQESLAQSAAAFNDNTRKSYNVPSQSFPFEQASQAFNSGSQYMNNFFNNQLRFPQFPAFPSFPQYQFNNLGSFQGFPPAAGGAQNIPNFPQFQPSQTPPSYISPNLRPLGVDPADDIDNNSGLIQYGNGHQNIGPHSEVTVHEESQDGGDMAENLDIDTNDDIVGNIFNDDTMTTMQGLNDEYGDPANLNVEESDREEAHLNEGEIDGMLNDEIQSVEATTECNSKPRESEKPLQNDALEVTTVSNDLTTADYMLDDSTDYAQTTTEEQTEMTTLSFGLDNRLDANAIKTLVG